MHSWSIDAWNQSGFREVSITARTSNGSEKDDRCIKLAIFSAGFKAGQSRAGGLGYEREVSQTLNANMSGTEPTMLNCLTPTHPQTNRVYALVSNSGAGQNQQSILINRKHSTPMNETQSPTPSHNEASTPCDATPEPPKAEVRRLTPLECSRLMGFPDGHLSVANQGDSSQYQEAGNSWARPCARFVIKNIHRVDERLRNGKV